jgi:hypothetical protein
MLEIDERPVGPDLLKQLLAGNPAHLVQRLYSNVPERATFLGTAI